ncbi:MAG: HAMP domain-containing sensor histidine kinase [Luteimonas sp.]
MPQGLPYKLRYAFLLQVTMASIVIVAGTFAAVSASKYLLSSQELQEEATYYWQHRALDPHLPPPDSAILHGYAVSAANSPRTDAPQGAIKPTALPVGLRNLSSGLHDLPDLLVLVQKRDGVVLYLTYPQAQLNRISFSLAVIPMLLALLAIGASSWFTYRVTRRMLAPVHWLAGVVRRWDPRDPDIAALEPDKLPPQSGSETRELAGALQRMGERMRAFVYRERDFTRDASHELRTPLTVIRVASDMLQDDPDLSQRAHRWLNRIQGAGRDMEAVIDAFLLLARENEVEPQREDFDVRTVVDEEIEKARPLLVGKPVEMLVIGDATPRLHALPRVLGLMLGNLLANACTYTERGLIEIGIYKDQLTISDSGIGMSAETLDKAFDPFFRGNPSNPSGRGMGLSIVRQLGERFGWPVTLESKFGVGTKATIRFNTGLGQEVDLNPHRRAGDPASTTS